MGSLTEYEREGRTFKKSLSDRQGFGSAVWILGLR
jgi:hypothetical protein